MKHISVLKNEVIKKLNLHDNGVYVDMTLGLGGHTNSILSIVKNSIIIAFDQDENAIEYVKKNINDNKNNKIYLINDNFKNLGNVLNSLNIKKVDGILYDLGPSYYQLTDINRGFTYHNEEVVLDMRMDPKQEIDAKFILNNYSEQKLTEIFWKFGEERKSRELAKSIINYREEKEILTNTQLNEIIKNVKGYQPAKHPSKNVYQALRIEVNKEFDVLQESLMQAMKYLNLNGRILVITFHSLEDKIVKDYFWKLKEYKIELEKENLSFFRTHKTIYPSKLEKTINKSSRSAKLRVLEKINEPDFTYWNER